MQKRRMAIFVAALFTAGLTAGVAQTASGGTGGQPTPTEAPEHDHAGHDHGTDASPHGAAPASERPAPISAEQRRADARRYAAEHPSHRLVCTQANGDISVISLRKVDPNAAPAYPADAGCQEGRP